MKIKKILLLFVIIFTFNIIHAQALFLKNKKYALGYEIGYGEIGYAIGSSKHRISGNVFHIINTTLFKHIDLFFGHSNNYGNTSINSTVLGILLYLNTKEKNTLKPVLHFGKSNSGKNSSTHLGASLYFDFISSPLSSLRLIPYIQASLLIQSGGNHIIGAGFDLGINSNEKFIFLVRPCYEYLVGSLGVDAFSISLCICYSLK